MSYYIDPWLFNCQANPADSPAEQLEQRTIIAATQLAVNYARSNGVTLVAAEGQQEHRHRHPTIDDTSPDLRHPPKTSRGRQRCLTKPTEAPA